MDLTTNGRDLMTTSLHYWIFERWVLRGIRTLSCLSFFSFLFSREFRVLRFQRPDVYLYHLPLHTVYRLPFFPSVGKTKIDRLIRDQRPPVPTVGVLGESVEMARFGVLRTLIFDRTET